MSRLSVNKKTFATNILCVLALTMFAFCPTSSNTVIYGLGRTILMWAVASIVVVVFALIGRINWGRLVLSLYFCMAYMVIVTLIAQIQFRSYHVSLARIAPLVVLLVLFEARVEKHPNFKLEIVLLNIFSICCIIWNVGIMLRIPDFQLFTYNNFNQYFDTALFYSVIENAKPVMSFGVHTYASFFYFIFFLLSYYTYEITEKRKYLLYCVAYIGFTLFLVSTTAIIYCFVMFIILGYKLLKRKQRKEFVWLLAFLAVAIFVLLWNFDFLYGKIYTNMTNGQNSFISRYAAESVFTENVKIIKSSLGIGFNILDDVNLGYSDSGYVVYLTMGNFPLMAYVYYKLFSFLKKNIPHKYFGAIAAVIYSFEFALPASFQQRFPFLIIFVIGYLKSLEAAEKTEVSYK